MLKCFDEALYLDNKGYDLLYADIIMDLYF